MASDLSFVNYIEDQLDLLDGIIYKKMFGEYAIYYKNKIVALICDNRLLIKMTEAGRAFIQSPKEDFPYPGAKPAFLIEEQLENKEWLRDLIICTEKELPMPKPRKKKKKSD